MRKNSIKHRDSCTSMYLSVKFYVKNARIWIQLNTMRHQDKHNFILEYGIHSGNVKHKANEIICQSHF